MITYIITGSAKWYFCYLIGLISGFAPEKNYPWKTPPFGNNCRLCMHSTSPSTKFSRRAVLDRSRKSLVGLEEIAELGHT